MKLSPRVVGIVGAVVVVVGGIALANRGHSDPGPTLNQQGNPGKASIDTKPTTDDPSSPPTQPPDSEKEGDEDGSDALPGDRSDVASDTSDAGSSDSSDSGSDRGGSDSDN
jgi:hypothetical protein